MEMIAVKLVFSSLFYIILVDNSYIEEIMLISEGIKDMNVVVKNILIIIVIL